MFFVLLDGSSGLMVTTALPTHPTGRITMGPRISVISANDARSEA